MRLYSLRDVISGVASAGRGVIAFGAGKKVARLDQLCRQLLAQQGEASVVALSQRILTAYRELPENGRLAFFEVLLHEFSAEPARIAEAIAAWQAEPSAASAVALGRAAEAPRQALIRLLNTAPGGTAALVGMRAQLLAHLGEHPALEVVDHDFVHLLRAWFNRGFLTLRRIDWHTPAFILEKLISYEAVHEIRGWPDLQRRLADDRRCYAFFHPALPDEPLIFVQVALVQGLASSIQDVLDAPQPPAGAEIAADTAIFYSISNCQRGLAGISFGHFLIKQVTESLALDVPGLKRYSTLSPIPGFRDWLRRIDPADADAELGEDERVLLATALDTAWEQDVELAQRLRPLLLRLCATYLLCARHGAEPRDAVARFHLRNGARLERINWLGDRSAKGLAESAGMLVNYLYDARTVAHNHEAYVNEHAIVCAPAVEALLGRRARIARQSGATG